MESGNLLAIMSALRPRATELLHRNELPLCAKRRATAPQPCGGGVRRRRPTPPTRYSSVTPCAWRPLASALRHLKKPLSPPTRASPQSASCPRLGHLNFTSP